MLTGGETWPESEIHSKNLSSPKPDSILGDEDDRFEIHYNLTCDKQVNQLRISNVTSDENQFTLLLSHSAGYLKNLNNKGGYDYFFFF